ncbi:MAG: glycosyltransferase [Synechococcaceae cyanobacterium]|nr:glycosyltransferase [Synechococcaceae cyanobacterium]
MSRSDPWLLSVVVPIYKGEHSIGALVEELKPLHDQLQRTPGGQPFRVSEVLLVHDCGPDRSDRVLEVLQERLPFVQAIWLSRNFGQHAATLAGMAAASGDWVATMDEDGQQDPASLPMMLDAALERDLQLVYARPLNPPPHGALRNLSSRAAKRITAALLGNDQIGRFNSFRLVEGEVARTLAAYCSQGVYLDVGLFWITGRVGHCPVRLRPERGRSSGYSWPGLFRHFWHLILTTGTKPLRLITAIGVGSVVLSLIVCLYALIGKVTGSIPVQGWSSLLVIVSFFSGCILISLGIIAEYLAVTMGIIMGRPLYVVATHPTRPPSPATPRQA